MISFKEIDKFVNSRTLALGNNEKKNIYSDINRLIKLDNAKVKKLKSKEIVILASFIHDSSDEFLDNIVDFYDSEIIKAVLGYEVNNNNNTCMIWYLTSEICGAEFLDKYDVDSTTKRIFRNTLLNNIKENGPDKVNYPEVYGCSILNDMDHLVI